MPKPVPASVLIIGVGNDFRGDDGIGLSVARALVHAVPENCQIMELPGEGSELMQVWKGGEIVIIIDACRSDAPLGQVVRIDASREPLPAGYFSYSTHAFGLAEAVETSRNLKTLPEKLIIYAIEGRAFEQGAQMSSPVESVISLVCREILREIESV